MSTPRERAEHAAGGQVPAQLLDSYQKVGRDLLAALDRVEELEEAPSVTCVAFDSHGNPFDTVRLLGDREAVLAVVQLRERVEELERALGQDGGGNETRLPVLLARSGKRAGYSRPTPSCPSVLSDPGDEHPERGIA